MALSKVTYINGTTVISAENLNAIQDEIIANAGSITSLGTDLTSISGTIAPIETTTTASQKHDVGEFFYLSNVLYEATVAIPVGGTITVGTNCKVANVGAELNSQSDRIDAKADAKGYSENMVAGSADQLLADTGVTEKVPYVYRASDHNSTRLKEKIVGGTIAWNQLVQTVSTSITVPNNHKYFSSINGTETIGISNGTGILINDGTKDNVFDLTQMFGSAVADQFLAMETANEGSGVAFFKSLFPKPYYAYNAGTLMSVNTSAHVMRDADENIIGNYPLDSSLTLRGIPKLDANNNVYYDGDTYESDGTVTRRYGIVDLGTLNWTRPSSGYFKTTDLADAIKAPANTSIVLDTTIISSSKYTPGSATNVINDPTTYDKMYCITNAAALCFSDSDYSDKNTFTTAMSGVYLVYELAETTTESAEPYQEVQIVDPNGTEEYVDAGATASTPTRDVSVPVGHDSFYHEDLKGKIEGLPKDLSFIAPCLTEFKADTALVANDFRIINNELYRITTSIASGGTITPNTNATKTTVGEALKALLNA